MPSLARRRIPTDRPVPRPDGSPPAAVERFRDLDDYRVGREWNRYEGTAQRALFRQLRQRFLARHRDPGRPAVDLGSGPGRFARDIGGDGGPLVLLDLSQVALTEARRRLWAERGERRAVHYARSDAARPALRSRRFGSIVLLGNVLGFSGATWPTVLTAAMDLAAPGGRLVIEGVAGAGERGRYLHRLPVGAAVRAVRSPAAWLDARIDAEGFQSMTSRKVGSDLSFTRLAATELRDRFVRSGWRIAEVMAVAPVTGAETERLEPVVNDPTSWAGLMALEERWGRRPDRWPSAAAFLIAAVAPGGEAAGPEPELPAVAAGRTGPRPASGRPRIAARRKPSLK